jgi:predicted anti-sigma-YlaC factor YlaD
MDCQETQKLLVARRDGELSKEAAAQVQAHLTQCAVCRVQVQQIDAVLADADTWHPLNMDTNILWEGVEAKITAPDLTDVLNEMRQMRQEMALMRAEVADLRRQISSRPSTARALSPRLFPYAPPADPPVSFH